MHCLFSLVTITIKTIYLKEFMKTLIVYSCRSCNSTVYSLIGLPTAYFLMQFATISKLTEEGNSGTDIVYDSK